MLARIIHEGFYSNRGTPLRQAWPLVLHGEADGLAARSVNILFKDASLPPAVGHCRLTGHWVLTDSHPVRKHDAP